ncbi:MAG: hypothetical protein ACK46S_09120 [Bacteroidota bacterium]|jgi:hypothetical protein
MTLQFIHDNNGNTTGVYIPIEDWQTLKVKYKELEREELNSGEELLSWQKEVIDVRLNEYYNNPTNVSDFGKSLDDLEKDL